MNTKLANVSRDQVLHNIHAITFGGAIGIHILQPFNTIANELPPEPEMLTGFGKARVVPRTNAVLFGAGSSKPAIATSQHLIVHLNAKANDEDPIDMKKFLFQSFGKAQILVMSSSIDPNWYSGELHHDVTIQVPLNLRALQASHQIIGELRPSK